MRWNERTVCMTLRDSRRVRICSGMIEGRLSEAEAANALQLSVRQVRRLKRRVTDEGDGGVIHRSRGRASPRRTPDEVRTEVEGLYRETYSGWNIQHFSEWLSSEHNMTLSRETLRQILIHEESRPKRRAGKRHHKCRDPRGREGELLQWDTSIHSWLGEEGEKAVLIAAIDDATKKIVWAEFFEHDGVIENMTVLRAIVRKYGIFNALYADGSTKFFRPDDEEIKARERGVRKEYTQFGRVANELGIQMIRAGSPQAKGRVERSFRTDQDRLVKELALKGIKTRSEANRYLKQRFIPHYNRLFAVVPADPFPFWEKPEKPFDELNMFCIKDHRKVQNDLTISVDGEHWQIHSGVRSGDEVELRLRLDRSVHIYKKDKEVGYHRIKRVADAASD